MRAPCLHRAFDMTRLKMELGISSQASLLATELASFMKTTI